MGKRTRQKNGVQEELQGQVAVTAVCDAATQLMTGVPNMENKLFILEMISETEWPAAEEMYGAMLRSCQSKPKQTVSLFLRMTAANTSMSGCTPQERLGQLSRLDSLLAAAKRRGLVSRKAEREIGKLADEVFVEIVGEAAEQGAGWFH